MLNKLICLNKNDRFIRQFAQGANLPLQDLDVIPDDPILFRGILKKDIIKDRLANGKLFYYMDSGYVGNYPYSRNFDGKKLYFRIVKNALQHSEIIDRPDDRWKKLKYPIEPWKSGDHILLVLPSEKPCKFYDIELDSWTTSTINTLKTYTDRPIKIRYKQPRNIRKVNTIYDDLKGAHAMVTFNSIAAVESILYGIPAFTLAPTAADPVCDKDLSQIETPTRCNDNKRYQWACHIAYGQFHIREIRSGKAYEMLNEDC
jgi:hypothetical protein